MAETSEIAGFTEIEWLPLQVNYKLEKKRIAMEKSSVLIHPLLPTVSKKNHNKKQEFNPIGGGNIERESVSSISLLDPLRSPALSPMRGLQLGSDPLSMSLLTSPIEDKVKKIPGLQNIQSQNTSQKASNTSQSKNSKTPQTVQSSQSKLRDVPGRAAVKTTWQIKKEQILSECNILMMDTDNRHHTHPTHHTYSTTDTTSRRNSTDIHSEDKNGNDDKYGFEDKYGLRLASLEKSSSSPSKMSGSNSKKIEVP